MEVSFKTRDMRATQFDDNIWDIRLRGLDLLIAEYYIDKQEVRINTTKMDMNRLCQLNELLNKVHDHTKS